MSYVLRFFVVAASLFCLPSIGPSTLVAQRATERVVAIGDIHGAEDSLVAILQAAGLIDQQRKWTGGRTRLVQTGDFTDRGPGVRNIMELLMRLEDEARRAGGRIEVLLGNHEGMNILRDRRDVSAEAYQSFADDNSEARRSRAFIAHATIARRSGQELNRNEWLRSHPAGYMEYVEAMGPSGRFGRWLRSRKVVAKVDDSLFMHAGIDPQSAESIDDINRRVEREIRTFDDAVETLLEAGLITPSFSLHEIVSTAAVELKRIAAVMREKEALEPEVTHAFIRRVQRLMSIDQWGLIAAQGPLWFRGYATLGEDAQPQIEALLKRLGAVRFVVGHTPQIPGRIGSRFGNRIFLIDTGMLTSYFKGGRPSALEIAGSRITAIYTDQREVMVD